MLPFENWALSSQPWISCDFLAWLKIIFEHELLVQAWLFSLKPSLNWTYFETTLIEIEPFVYLPPLPP